MGFGADCTELAAALTIEGVIAGGGAAAGGGPSFACATADDNEVLMLLPDARAESGGSPGPPQIMRRFNAALMCLWMGSAID